ncbi:CaiB/BaiF CoA-transferase family protein [Haloechinothrix salitolerans]|uniref:CaiB/BaiF CoA-transferase family protein n=1 Tax=Haloechinothrix salitolerans TaxID=926830 RepID=A0ABW2C628_9PSEU
MTLPLQGVVVVSAEQALAGPLASRSLADLGATVVKVERPDGGDFARDYDSVVHGVASAFAWLNRSKKSVVIDLQRPEATKVMRALLARADVFLSNLKPGSLSKLGYSDELLASTYPNLITCTIDGYGSAGGRYAGKKAYDLMIQAESGLMSLTGTEKQPARAGISVADIAAGSQASQAILAALIERERTGHARRVRISLLDSLAEWMGHPLLYAMHGGSQQRRTGTSHPTIAPYGQFAVADGQVMLAVQNQREWRRLCDEVLLRTRLSDDPRFVNNAARVANRAELRDEVEAAFRDVPAAEALARLDAANIANARLNDVQSFVDEYKALAPDRWFTVQTADADFQAVLPPQFDEDFVPQNAPVPDLGQHTQEVLAWAGIASEEIDSLLSDGIAGVRK